uniref:TraI helicase-associated ssDBD N-terminal domain-containing protein n=1 Tax=Salmonella enterica subsp. enterica serovar Choleraesuis TaxID=119912 RepID=Q9EUJ6_SALET|nr:unnamed protein product [Salmonella enterica subsp. enterica serovar Choleraesuis]
MKQNRVTVHPEKSVPRGSYSDAVSVLARDRPSLAIISGQGGAAGQRERVAELTMMAREQTLIVTHLNEDRRVLNSMIQDALAKPSEQQVTVPVLTTANIRDGELRRLSTWENHQGALALVDNVYHRIAGISKEDGLITDADGTRA